METPNQEIAALIDLGVIAGMDYVASPINKAFSMVGNKLSNAEGT